MITVPLQLKGERLGIRQLQLNTLVNEAFKSNVPFELIRHLPEKSDVDRFYKIDLANKYQIVDYIIENLQCEDMLYVSRALKSTWLIIESKYEDIINPNYLYEKLYPQMLVTAMNKTIHTIELHLKDENRCQLFYEYFNKQKNESSYKYLPKCPSDFVMEEIKKNNLAITPHMLKLLSENNPSVAEYYFKHSITMEPWIKQFNNDSEKYVHAIKFMLKTHTDLYLDILEKHNLLNFKRLSAAATDYIMKTEKRRLLAKPELYAARILDLNYVARHLSTEEIKDLILRLAKAEYLNNWFSYKSVEPLLKRLPRDGKSVFVRSVFVEKSFGPQIKEPAYEFPKLTIYKECTRLLPVRRYRAMSFDDQFRCGKRGVVKKRAITKRKGKYVSPMDDLYNAHRFDNFAKTFVVLKKRIQGEPNHNNRQIMLTVLITKSKNNDENINKLLQYFVEKHLNEPITLKCSFARTIVKQTNAYKFNTENWKLLELIFYNIGVFTECEENITVCTEAIIVYSVLNNLAVPDEVFTKYLSSFTTMQDLSLTSMEKEKLFDVIFCNVFVKIEQNIKERNYNEAVNVLWKLLELIESRKKSLLDYTKILDMIKEIAAADEYVCRAVLLHLYDKKECRKIFFKELFTIRRSVYSYMNALKHDVNILASNFDKFINDLNDGSSKPEKFLKKVFIYFHNDLAKQYRVLFEDTNWSLDDEILAQTVSRGLCILKSPVIKSVMEMRPDTKDKVKGKERKQNFNKFIIKNLFLARPALPIGTFIMLKGSSIVPLTILSNRHPKGKCISYIRDLLEGPKQFIKHAVRLTFNKLNNEDILKICKNVYESNKSNGIRLVLLKETHKILCRTLAGDFQAKVWQYLNDIIHNLKVKQKHEVYKFLSNIRLVPDGIKAEYCETVYNFLASAQIDEVEYRGDILKYMHGNIEEFNDIFICDSLKEFLKHEFTCAKLLNNRTHMGTDYMNLMLQIAPRYLLFCKTPQEQLHRFENIWKPFFCIVKQLWTNEKFSTKRTFYHFLIRLNDFMKPQWTDAANLFECILKEVEEFLTFEQYFKFYCLLQMSFAHLRALKYSFEQNPDFISDKDVQKMLISNISFNLGRHIGETIEELTKQYSLTVFEIKQIYTSSCFSEQFSQYCEDRDEFHIGLLKGLIEDENRTNSILFAIEYFASDVGWISPDYEKRYNAIVEKLMDINIFEVKMFLHAKLTRHIVKALIEKHLV